MTQETLEYYKQVTEEGGLLTWKEFQNLQVGDTFTLVKGVGGPLLESKKTRIDTFILKEKSIKVHGGIQEGFVQAQWIKEGNKQVSGSMGGLAAVHFPKTAIKPPEFNPQISLTDFTKLLEDWLQATGYVRQVSDTRAELYLDNVQIGRDAESTKNTLIQSYSKSFQEYIKNKIK